MKRLLGVAAAMVLFMAATVVMAQNPSAAKLVVDTPQVTLSKKTVVQLSGHGFKPGQEIAVLFTAVDGVLSDIGFALDPAPVADQDGNWKTTWKCGRFIKKKLIKAGTYTLKAADTDYNVMAEATVTFVSGK